MHENHQKDLQKDPKSKWDWRQLEREIFPENKPPPPQPEAISYIPEEEEATLRADYEAELEQIEDFPLIKARRHAQLKLPVVPTMREKKANKDGSATGGGGRKTARAQATLRRGNGEILVNGRNFALYFTQLAWRERVLDPFVIAERISYYNVNATVYGGGKGCQADALRLAIVNALTHFSPRFVFVCCVFCCVCFVVCVLLCVLCVLCVCVVCCVVFCVCVCVCVVYCVYCVLCIVLYFLSLFLSIKHSQTHFLFIFIW
jgi:ribosomal protein S9